jgi:hypothetical protein
MLLVSACDAAATPTPSGPIALEPGTYTTQAFTPGFSYTVPAGWANPSDFVDHFSIQPAGSDVVGIFLFSNPLPMSQDRTCPDAGEPGVGTSAADLITWIRAHPGLEVSPPRLAAVGGLRGTELDLRIKDGWSFSCSYANGLPTVPLFFGSSGGYRWVVVGSEQLRLDILDGPGGSTIVVDMDAFEGDLFQDLVNAASPIVRSITFEGQ